MSVFATNFVWSVSGIKIRDHLQGYCLDAAASLE